MTISVLAIGTAAGVSPAAAQSAPAAASRSETELLVPPQGGAFEVLASEIMFR